MSGSGTQALLFTYTVQAGETDADGIELGALALAGSTMKDAAGNDASLTLAGAGSTADVRVDTTAPVISSATRSANNQIIVELNEAAVHIAKANDGGFAVHETGAPGKTYAVASIAQGTDSRHVVLTLADMGASAKEGVTVQYTAGVNGTIADLAGNALVTTTTGAAIAPWDLTGPTIVDAVIGSSNAYVDITFSEGIYGDADAATPIAPDDLALTLSKSGAQNVVIASVKKNDAAREAAAGALTGGETVIRVFLTVTGVPNGTDAIDIKPADAASIYDQAGNAAEESAATGTKSLINMVPSSNSSPQPQTQTEDDGVAVIVNGEVQEKTATAKVTTTNGQKVTSVQVDETKLNEKLASVGDGYVVTIPVNNQSKVVVGELNARMVKNMEQKAAVLEVKTERAGYALPAQQVNVDAISRQIGSEVALEDIRIRVEITNIPDEEVTFMPDANNNIQIIAPAIDFTIKAIYDDQEVAVQKFNAYVERTIAIPEGVDPNRITTGVVIASDGRTLHVPTRVTRVDDKYYAVINSVSNSVYTVIYNVKTFEDTASHWGKQAIENMASRLVVNGANDREFRPDNSITRAEFTAIIVRALGLHIADQSVSFADVPSDAWFQEAVQVGISYGLIRGYQDGNFRPNATITREEAMVIVARAMSIAKLNTDITDKQQGELLGTFADEAGISSWARDAAALNIEHRIVGGYQNQMLSSHNITRAETAVIIERLLKQADLI